MDLEFNIEYIALIILVLSIVAGIIITIYQFFRNLINHFFKDQINRYLLIWKLKPKYQQVLAEKFHYYQQLDYADQRLFEKRVQKFINMKSFVPRGEIKEISPEMKTLIAGAAIQITFGYPGIYFEHFWKIILYETDYYSKITQYYHQGEVNTRGFIILTWRKFKEGFDQGTSGRNLGLHEMAHALKIENTILNQEYNFLDDTDLKRFNALAKDEMSHIRNGGSKFFRDYAGTNIHEFFAVSIENFFERPHNFYEYNPKLYNVMVDLLKQNPRSKHPPSN